jgi:hypothetical protein
MSVILARNILIPISFLLFVLNKGRSNAIYQRLLYFLRPLKASVYSTIDQLVPTKKSRNNRMLLLEMGLFQAILQYVVKSPESIIKTRVKNKNVFIIAVLIGIKKANNSAQTNAAELLNSWNFVLLVIVKLIIFLSFFSNTDYVVR